MPSLATPRSVTPCPSDPGASTVPAVLHSIAVGNNPKSVAVNALDDTVYVGNTTTKSLSLVNGATGMPVGSEVPLPQIPRGIAVNQGDDTVYVATADDTVASDDTQVMVLTGGGVPVTVVGVGETPTGVAVDQTDDTVYVTNYDDSSVSVINGATNDVVGTVDVSTQPTGVAVWNADDTVYVANRGTTSPSGLVSIFNGRTLDDTGTVGVYPSPENIAVNEGTPSGPGDDSVYVTAHGATELYMFSVSDPSSKTYIQLRSSAGGGVAVDDSDATVYVGTGYAEGAGWLEMVNGRTGQLLDDSLWVGNAAWGIAVDQSGPNRGLVYVANDDSLVVVGRASARLGSRSGYSGATARVYVDAPQVDYPLDDSTVEMVCFGSSEASGLVAAAGDRWNVLVPVGSLGTTVPVTVVLKGGLVASAGSFTYVRRPPVPPVTFPPGPPVDVQAASGDAAAAVHWQAPLDSGSSPVTDYEVVSSPTAGTCTASMPSTSCEVRSLANGTTYTFTVRARNAVGWGVWSSPSNPVVPQEPVEPSIVITGSRLATVPSSVGVSGVTTGLAGTQVTPRVRLAGQTSYSTGAARPSVQPDGTFTWTRNTNKRIYVYFLGESVRSNRVIIESRH